MGHLCKGGYIFCEIENNLEPAEKIWVQNMEKKNCNFFQLVANANSPILPQIFIHIHTLRKNFFFQNPETHLNYKTRLWKVYNEQKFP